MERIELLALAAWFIMWGIEQVFVVKTPIYRSIMTVLAFLIGIIIILGFIR